MVNYDVIIIGAGPAGLSAGLYCGRLNLKTLILTRTIGGQVAYASEIENYLGVNKTSGTDLSQKFMEQVQKNNVEIKYELATKIERGDTIKVHGSKTYKTKTLILAMGREPKLLGVKGESEFFGRGVSTCAVCDGPLFRGKKISVVGGGNSAVDAVYYLSSMAKEVKLIHRRKEFRAYDFMLKKIKKDNVKIKTPFVVEEVLGSKKVEGVVIKNTKTGKKETLNIDGLFVEIGHNVNAEIYKEIIDVNEKGEILVDVDCRTSEQNIFAAGDVTSSMHKQAIISSGEGAKAALSAYRYITSRPTKT